MRKHIVHHTKRVIHHVRSKPYDSRVQIVRFLTLFCGGLVVLLWITLLKHQLQSDNVTKKSDTATKSLFTEQIIRVYGDAKNNTSTTSKENNK
jgi:hypothetical protein